MVCIDLGMPAGASDLREAEDPICVGPENRVVTISPRAMLATGERPPKKHRPAALFTMLKSVAAMNTAPIPWSAVGAATYSRAGSRFASGRRAFWEAGASGVLDRTYVDENDVLPARGMRTLLVGNVEEIQLKVACAGTIVNVGSLGRNGV